MTDGTGSASYSYNQHSQVTSETRLFTGLGSYKFGYDYNLGGELQSLTDPFGATINYSYDPSGRLSSVTGSSFGGVTTYASNPQYRAWGALKSLSYGNSKTLSVAYDSRLQPSSYEVPGVLQKSYQRNDDGRVSFTQDQLTTNSKFDRSYTYDQVGRVATALTGQEARGGAATNDRPYNDALTYDALNHLTSLERLHWDRADGFGPQSFVNNRVSGWSYDADGRLTSGSTGYFTYDAAGRAVTFGDNDPYKSDQMFDGDGRRVRTIAQRFDEQTEFVTEKVTYYVNSAVLGGAVVTELSEEGAKERTTVLAGGSELASQTILDGTQWVQWQHYDPSGASYRATNPSGQSVDAKEMDPLGANAGLIKPPTWNVPDKHGLPVPHPLIADMLLNPGGGCTLDRMPIPCEIRNTLMEAGAVQNETLINRGNGWRTYRDPVRPRGVGVFTTINYYVDRYGEPRANSLVITVPQNPYDPRADFRDYAKQLSNNRNFTNDCQKLALLIYKAGQVWDRDGSDAIVTGLLSGLTELSSIGRTGTTPSDPNFRVGVLGRDPHFGASFDQRGFNGSYDGGGFINDFRDNQVRHFVGWFAAGYSTDWAFAEAALFHQEGTLRNRDPDAALGRAAIGLVVLSPGTSENWPKMSGLRYAARRTR